MPYEKKREAWKLKEQGLSFTQIAERLDISPGEVIQRLYDWGARGNHLREGAGVQRRSVRDST